MPLATQQLGVVYSVTLPVFTDKVRVSELSPVTLPNRSENRRFLFTALIHNMGAAYQ